MDNLLKKYGINISYEEILSMWNRDVNSYHNQKHLFDLYQQIDNKYSINSKNWEILYLSAMFHDIIYDTNSKDNENNSIEFLLNNTPNITDDIITICDIIKDTITHNGRSELSKIFQDMDMDILNRSIKELIIYENGIYFEFGHHINYKRLRLEFINTIFDKSSNKDNLRKLIKYINLNYF